MMKDITCPSCGSVNDAASEVDSLDGAGNYKPKVGDIGVCEACSELFTVEADGVRILTDDELLALPAEEIQQVARARMVAEYMRRMLGRTKREVMRS